MLDSLVLSRFKQGLLTLIIITISRLSVLAFEGMLFNLCRAVCLCQFLGGHDFTVFSTVSLGMIKCVYLAFSFNLKCSSVAFSEIICGWPDFQVVFISYSPPPPPPPITPKLVYEGKQKCSL